MCETHGVSHPQAIEQRYPGEYIYAIMADECTDVSNVEQFTICIRWVDKYLESHESFIGLYEVDSITSDTLVSAIKDTLVRLNVKLTVSAMTEHQI